MTKLPPEIAVIEQPDGVVFVLPRRDIGGARMVGCMLGAFGMFFAVAAGGASLLTLVTGGGRIETSELIVTILLSLPFVLAGLFFAGVGALIFAGRSEVEVRGETLRVVERVGVLRWVRRRPLEGIERFNITSLVEQRNRDGDGDGPGRDAVVIKVGDGDGDGPPMHFIAVEGKGIKPIKIAGGYSRPMLRALAEALAERVERASATAMPREPVEIVEGQAMFRGVEAQRLRKALHREGDSVARVDAGEAESTAEDVEAAARPIAQPVTSRAELLREADGLTIVLPPAGFGGVNRSLAIFSTFWLLLVGGISIMMLRELFNGKKSFEWAMIPFLLMFWGVGIAMATFAIYLARRHAVIGVIGDTLLVTQTNLFRSTQHEWTRDRLRHIRRGDSGMKINNQTVPDLKIVLDDQTTKGLFAGRDTAELDWIADVLRRAMRLDS